MSEKKYPDDEPYRFHWLDGSKTEGYGRDPADAMNRMGYGAGALRALDYYEKAQPLPPPPSETMER